MRPPEDCFGPVGFEPNEPLQRHGDLFPLPLLAPESGCVVRPRGRRGQRRVSRREILRERANETIAVENEVAGCVVWESWPAEAPNEAQRVPLRGIRAAHTARAAPDAPLQPEAALQDLLCAGA